MSRVLIVEDEDAIAEIEKDYLELSGFEVVIKSDGTSGLATALEEDFDIMILDVMLPGVDGYEICKQVREKKNTPIIMVSAKKEDIDKIRGLGVGADDYMTKPFSPSELVARVKAHLARYERLVSSAKEANDIIEIRGLKIDKTARRVFVNGEEKVFTTKEFDLLTFLAEHPNHVFTKDELFKEIWDMDSIGDIATVTVHIKKIREKIEYDTSKEVMLARINKLEQAIRSGNIQVNTNLEEVKSQVSNEASNNKTLNNKQQKINGIAKYENNINYYFNIYDGITPIKSGKSNSLLLPNYSSEFVSEDVFTKVDENIYEVKTSTLAKYVAEQIIDNEHKNAIDGHNSIYSSSYQGTNALRIELKDGHVSTITYNYVASNKLIDGIINVTNINATSLGFIFKTKDLRPIQPGYENFCGYFDSWEYGTSDDIDNKEYYHLLVYGDGKYSISYKTTGETEEIKQGILNKENNTFTIVLKGEQITLTYCPAGTKMDLGYASLTERSFPVLYGKTDDKSHIVTFKLDKNSEYNIDSGLVKGE